jgi:glutamate 5-kinase
VVPIINENDAVSFTEIKVGDNDTLSALVASLVARGPAGDSHHRGWGHPKLRPAGREGDFHHRSDRRRTWKNRRRDDERNGRRRHGDEDSGGEDRGALRHPARHRFGPQTRRAREHFNPELEEGTLFIAQEGKLRGRKRWIAFFHHPKGALFVDEGAKTALREAGKSLLPPGVSRCEGNFLAGDVIRICDLNGTEFARGIAQVHWRGRPRSQSGAGGTRASG